MGISIIMIEIETLDFSKENVDVTGVVLWYSYYSNLVRQLEYTMWQSWIIYCQLAWLGQIQNRSESGQAIKTELPNQHMRVMKKS